jgi:hypothetical protein
MEYLTRLAYSSKSVPENRAIYLSITLEEKRKLYKCKDNYVTLDQIKAWPQYYENNKVFRKLGNNLFKLKICFYFNFKLISKQSKIDKIGQFTRYQ